MSEINELLERYYNAETTKEEEEIIATYFASGGHSVQPADSLLFAGKDAYRKYLPFRHKKRPESVRIFVLTASVAAVLLMGVLISRINTRDAPRPRREIAAQILIEQPLSGDITNERQALEQARKALTYISAQLNKGAQGVSQLDKLESSLSKIKTEQL